MKHIKRNVFVAVIVFLLVGGAVFAAGAFPVARANGDTILFREYSRYRMFIKNFQENADQFEQVMPGGAELAHVPAPDIPRAALERLIGQTIQKRALENEGGVAATNAVEQSFNNLLQGRDILLLKQGSQNIFGISFDEFKIFVLLPQTRTLVLRAALQEQGQEYEAWMREHAQSADVTIYFLPYRWRDGKVVAN